jgi:hypothetical protein
MGQVTGLPGYQGRLTTFPTRASSAQDRPTALLLCVALGVVLFIIGLTVLAYHRRPLLILTILVPILALRMPAELNRHWPWVQGLAAKLIERLPVLGNLLTPFFFLVCIPAFLVFGISFFKPLLGSRLFLLFTPYLLVLIATGMTSWFRRPALGVPLVLLMTAMHVLSMQYFREFPKTPRDYQSLAEQLKARLGEEDLIFVHSRSWVTTPLFYYLERSKNQLVAHDYSGARSRRPSSRIWVIDFLGQPPTSEMQEALKDYSLQDQVRARRARGLLYSCEGLEETYPYSAAPQPRGSSDADRR